MKRILPWLVAALCAVGLFASTAGASSSDPVPSCQKAMVSIGSHNYHVQACNTRADDWIKAPPTGKRWDITFSGGLANGSSIFAFPYTPVSPSPSPSPSPANLTAMSAKQIASLPDLPGCFNHHGVQLSTHLAYECIDQSVAGGALYWSANLADFNWDKHPASGLDWVEASTIIPEPTANPPQNRQAFWVGIAHNRSFCTVIDPGYDQHPTQCEVDGAIHTMTARQQASYDAFAAAMTAAKVPDCAWSQTISSSQCNV